MTTPEALILWANNVADQWRSEKIQLAEGVSIQAINDLESLLLIKFPDSFKFLYNRVNGFIEMDWNTYMFSMWPVDRIIEEHNYQRHPDFVGFCDFLINSHYIGFSRSQTGVFKRYDLAGHSDPEKIADTFEEAIEMINTNASQLS